MYSWVESRTELQAGEFGVTFGAMEQAQLLTVPQVADRLQVNQETIRRWLRDGALKGVRFGAGRATEWRVDPVDLQTFIDERKTG